jgi:hypothetical protein
MAHLALLGTVNGGVLKEFSAKRQHGEGETAEEKIGHEGAKAARATREKFIGDPFRITGLVSPRSATIIT